MLEVLANQCGDWRLPEAAAWVLTAPNSGGSLFTVAIVSFVIYKYNPLPTPTAIPYHISDHWSLDLD